MTYGNWHDIRQHRARRSELPILATVFGPRSVGFDDVISGSSKPLSYCVLLRTVYPIDSRQRDCGKPCGRMWLWSVPVKLTWS